MTILHYIFIRRDLELMVPVPPHPPARLEVSWGLRLHSCTAALLGSQLRHSHGLLENMTEVWVGETWSD